MKKIILFVSILLTAFMGVLVGCESDPYADLSVRVTAVKYASTGELVEYDKGKDCYLLYDDSPVVISATVTSSRVVSPALIFKNFNEDSIKTISTSSSMTRSLTLNAVAPSSGVCRVNIASVESSKGSTNIYFKVMNPVKQIVAASRLMATYGQPLDLSKNLKVEYTGSFLASSGLGQSGKYDVSEDEKGVEYSLVSFTNNLRKTFDLVTKNDNENIFYAQSRETGVVSDTAAFSLLDGVLKVEDRTLKGSVEMEVLSAKYNKNIEATLEGNNSLTEPEKTARRVANEQLKYSLSVELVTPISLEDISFVSVNNSTQMVEGGQFVFLDMDDDDVRDVKLEGLIYKGSSAEYQVGGGTFSYGREVIKLTVQTSEDFELSFGGESNIFDVNVQNGDTVMSGLVVVSRTKFLTITPGTSAGVAQIDFVIKFNFAGAENSILFKFSELYAEYLSSLETTEFDALEDYAKRDKLILNVSSLPTDLKVSKQGEIVELNSSSVVKIYDSYSSEKGQQFKVSLAGNNVLSENKVVRVYFLGSAANENLVVKDYAGLTKNLLPTTSEDEYSGVYFDLDLSEESNRDFYVKANEIGIGNEYSIKLKNLIATKVLAWDGEEVDSSDIVPKQAAFEITTNSGVQEILIKTPIKEESETIFVSLDNNNVGGNDVQYKSLVLKLHEEPTLLSFMIKTGLVNDITIAFDDEFLTVLTVADTGFALANTLFAEDIATTTYQRFLVKVKGDKLGNSIITFTAGNGYHVTVNVKIVMAFNAAFSLRDNDVYGNGVYYVTQKLSADNQETLSVKRGGAFDIALATTTDRTGVISINYLSSNPSIATVDTAGKVIAVGEGNCDIFVTVNYFAFSKVNGYYQWTAKEESRSFRLQSFVPSSIKGLSAYVLEVYSYDSLGESYKGRASVNLKVNLDENATIAKEANIANAVSFEVDAFLTSYLSGAEFNGLNFLAVARLQHTSENFRNVTLTIVIEEFGVTTRLLCSINIYRAVQVEEIKLSGRRENGDVLVMKPYEGSVSAEGGAYVVAVKTGEVLTLSSIINPKNALVGDLTVAVYKADASTLKIGEKDTGKNFATLTYQTNKTQTDQTNKTQTEVVVNGEDVFSLNIWGNSGYFYVVIYANDRVSSSANYEFGVHLVLLVEITDGEEYGYVIYNERDLRNIQSNKNYVLGADIHTTSTWSPLASFSGTLNGYNENTNSFYKISGLKIKTVGQYMGLFAEISSSGAVLNLKVEAEVSVSVLYYEGQHDINIGVIAGKNSGLIMNCAVSFDTFNVNIITNNANIGGMVGNNEGGDIFNFSTSLSSELSNLAQYRSDRININQQTNILIGATPVSGEMKISDGGTKYVYVGGIAGKSSGYINGLYGVKNYLNELRETEGTTGILSNFNAFQDAGFDVNVSINGDYSKAGSVTNAESSIGGIVGLMTGGMIANVAATGAVGSIQNLTSSSANLRGVKNNAGGIVGKVSGNSGQLTLKNILSTVVVRGEENVGGVVGRANNVDFKIVRVENYGERNKTLVAGVKYVGGVVGFATGSYFGKVYSYSYVDKFNVDYMPFGDVFAMASSPVVGGIGGLVTESSSVGYATAVFSNFNVAAKNNSSGGFLAGIFGQATKAGTYNSGKIDEFGYVGVVSNNGDNKVHGVMNIIDGTVGFNVSSLFDGYYYYYLLQYGMKDSQTILYLPKDADEIIYYEESNDDNVDEGEYSLKTDAEGNLIKYVGFSYYEIEEVGGEEVFSSDPVTQSKFGFKYKIAPSADNEANFLKVLPVDIAIGINGASAQLEVANYKLVFATDGDKNYYFNYEVEEVQTLVFLFSANKTEFNLSDIFSVVPTPKGVKNFNLVAKSSAPERLLVTNDGKLVIKNIGNLTLTIYVRENSEISKTINVKIVRDFDQLLLSSKLQLSDSFFTGTDLNPTLVPLGISINFHYDFVKKTFVSSEDASSSGESGNYTINSITDKDFYSLELLVFFNGSNVTDNVDYYEKGIGRSLIFKRQGKFEIRAQVTFSLDGKRYIFTNDDWVFYLNVVPQASEISFTVSSESSRVLKSTETATFTVCLESVTAMDVLFRVYDESNNIVEDFFDISVTSAENAISQNNAFYYIMQVSVKEDKKNLTQREEYFIVAYVEQGSSLFETTSRLKIVVGPQSVDDVSLVHYSFTEKTSKLVNVVNTETYASPNYSYSFTKNSSSYIISGSEGLVVIDLYPYYANISSVTIESSQGNIGDAVRFLQMVQIDSNTTSKYYINGPDTTTTVNGGIKLNLVSYVPSDVATLTIDSLGQSRLNLIADDMKYSFGKESGNADWGRLYVKTIAPSMLTNGSTFAIKVTVTYTSIDGEGIVAQRQEVETKILSVESVPGLSLLVTHEGKNREVIAYTGQNNTTVLGDDYLILTPVLTQEQVFDSIAVSVMRSNNFIEDAGDYVTVANRNDGTYLLTLGPSAGVGDIITLKLIAEVSYDGYIIEKSYIVMVTVVDVVINDVKIRNMDANNNVKLTIATTQAFKVDVLGYGLESALIRVANSIARSMSGNGESLRYWYANVGGYASLTDLGVRGELPFDLDFMDLANSGDAKNFEVNSLCLGVSTAQQTIFFNTTEKLVVMRAGVDTASVGMRLAFSYVYKNGEVVLVPNYATDTTYYFEENFNIFVTQGEPSENLEPVKTAQDFKDMKKNGYYILMNDISLDNYTAINAEFASFDGNNKIITINNFQYSTSLSSSSSVYSINLGLFDTVSSGSVVKNVIVALPNNKAERSERLYESAMNLTGYSTVNFGGIAAVNYGMITNCEVITTHVNQTAKNNYDIALNSSLPLGSSNYIFDYTLYMQTSNTATVNVGGLVGINAATGIITNSRVGREQVTLLDVSEDSVVATEYSYALTAPRTIISVSGAGNVGGFAAMNLGSISSSYAKNMQIEVFSEFLAADIIKTAGFAVANSGYIYGSFVAGWEENNTVVGASDNRKLGGGIFSNGKVAGFVYDNINYVEDCYSNINLSGDYTFAAVTAKVMADFESSGATGSHNPNASGFVYKMNSSAVVLTSYSLSKIDNTTSSHSYFEGNPQNTGESPSDEYVGTVEDCYYMLESSETSSSSTKERAWQLSDNPVVDSSGTQSSGLNEFVSTESFNNFCFDMSEGSFDEILANSTGGVWVIYSDGLGGFPELIGANRIAISSRVMTLQASAEQDGEAERSFHYVESYAIGTSINPYLIADFEDYNAIFKDVSAQGSLGNTVSSKFTGNIRLINNIEFPSSTTQTIYSTSVEYTSLVESVSIFDGNYLAMYNIRLVDSNVGRAAYGLFRDIYNAGVKNLTLGITTVTAANDVAVGGLAGVIVDSNISNVKIVATSQTSKVLGKNYVGALAGIIVSSNSDASYSISRIKSNLSVTGSSKSSTSSITSSFEIWNAIKPIGAASSNLNLGNLDISVNYAGGIAGVVDLRQFSEMGEDAATTEPNATNITVGAMVRSSVINGLNYNYGNVNVYSDFTGGLFGFVGTQTYVANSSFVASSDSKLTSFEVAGGITAINFGTLSKTSVTYGQTDLATSDKNIVNYLSGGAYVPDINETLFSGASDDEPNYIGGLVGINAGNQTSGSGRILDSYNRLAVKNSRATAVGGIVGGSYVGEIKNVYTTATLMANLNSSEQVYMGAIVGRIFDEGIGKYFQEIQLISSESNRSYQLDLTYIVAANIWNPNDFEDLFTYTSMGDNNCVVGALYGKYENKVLTGTDRGIVSVNDGVYVQNLILDSFNYNYVKNLNISEEEFDEGELITSLGSGDREYHYIPLFGVNSSQNYDEYLSSNLVGNGGKNLIYPNKMVDLLGEFFRSSTLREIYFSSNNWLESTWDYSEENILPLLKYGYESSLIRIYTAQQFIDELSSPDTLSKKYIVMNDIDFSGVTMDVFTDPFRGTLSGNAVTIEQNGSIFSRYPVLFNISLIGIDLLRDFAIFQTTVDATISNLNFVISKYNAVFSNQVTTETKAAILVANAINTTITDVNIYSSLNDIVSKEISSMEETLGGKTHFVTSGVKINNLNNAEGYSDAFLQLATLNPQIEVPTHNAPALLRNKYYFLYSSQGWEGEAATYTYNLSYAKAPLSIINFVDIELVEGDYTFVKNVENLDGMVTNASTAGQFVAASVTSILNLANCATTFNMTIIYNSRNMFSTKYVGAFVGNFIGSGIKLFTSSDISVSCNYTVNNSIGDMDVLYAGGAFGRMQGAMKNIFSKNAIINVGVQGRAVLTTNTGSGGLFIGGLVGAAGEFVTIDSGQRVTGTISNIELKDLTMNVFVSGKSAIAGVVGQNRYNISSLNILQTNATEKTMNVRVEESQATVFVGGVLGENMASELSGIYSNLSINITAGLCDELYAGGIVAALNKSCNFISVINDGDYLNVSRIKISESYVPGVLLAGGITGGASGSNASTITLNKVLSTMDVICDQEKVMFVGGAIGKAETVNASSLLVLGDVTLNRGRGTQSGSYFYKDTNSDENYYYYIGGLVGMYSKYVCGENDGSTLVLSTIRDYAVGQKLNLNVGSVVGRKNVNNSTSTDALISHKNNKKTYYNENISLTNSDTYVNNEFTNVVQGNLLGIFSDIVSKIDGVLDMYTGDHYSKLRSEYGTVGQYVSGSKITPITFTSGMSLENNKHYILTGNLSLTDSINTTATGWTFNAQGYSAMATNKPLFKTITTNSAVIAVFSKVNATGVTIYAPIAQNNYGFVFSCGTAGNISGTDGLAGLVHTNYGVISTCFSIASITAKSGAGLVLYNGTSSNQNQLGNIYNSYFTGEVKADPSAGQDSYFSGFTISSVYGVISNCYTMADVDAEGRRIAPLAYLEPSNTLENIYRSYYDYLPTSFGDQEQFKNQEEYKAEKDINSTEGRTILSENVSCISPKGFYVYSYSLSGKRTDTSYVDVASMFSTHWITPETLSSTSADSELVSLFKMTEKYDPTETLQVDSTWFNYAYVTKNYKNVVLQSRLDDYFDMIYTGNGLAKDTNTTEKTHNFVDEPYKIKHAGMLEMYMLINYMKDTPEYKFYIFTKNINFGKYSGQIYWSKHLDSAKAYFVGDLNGNNKVVYNMYSSNGLLRALPNIENVNSTDATRTQVYDITFTASYSQTGLVAGFMGNGILSGIDVDSSISSIGGNSYVYNGDLFNIVNKDVFVEEKTEIVNGQTVKKRIDLFEKRITEISVFFYSSSGTSSSKNFTKKIEGVNAAFAGGLIGFMQGGEISVTKVGEEYVGAEFSGLFVMVNDRDHKDESYAGGLVGAMVAGRIGGDEEHLFNVQGISVYSCLDNGSLTDESGKSVSKAVSFSHIGGVVGLLSTIGNIKATLSYVNVSSSTETTSSVGLLGYHTIGGLVGHVNGGDITGSIYDANKEIDVSTVTISRNSSTGKTMISKSSVSDSGDKRLRDLVATDIYIGGIAGKLERGRIEGCVYGKNASFGTSVVYLGGYYSVIFGGIVGDLYQSNKNNSAVIENCLSAGSVNISAAKTGIVGGIIGRMRGGEVKDCATGYYREGGVLKVSNDSSLTSFIYFVLTDGFSWKEPSLIDNWGNEITDFDALWDNYWAGRKWISGTLNYYPKEFTQDVSYVDVKNSNGRGQNVISSSLGATFSTYGYSVAGGIVGSMVYGILDGSKEGDTDFHIFNNAPILANSSAGGIVGEVVITAVNGSQTVTIKNVKNTGDIRAFSTLNIQASANAGGSIIEEFKTGDGYYVKEESLNATLFLRASFYASLKESCAGGIVGYVFSSTNRTVTTPVVSINNCETSSLRIGSVLTTFSGGIVGLAADASSNEHIVIENCKTETTLLGFLLRSFAGGIVGYSNYVTIRNCNARNFAVDIIYDKLSETEGDLSDNEITSILLYLLTPEILVSVPNIIGGIVGYMQNGLVEDCNTDFGLLFSTRVAGGFIGVMAGGTLQATSDHSIYGKYMMNKSIVYAISGIAGGIVGLMRGGRIVTTVSLEKTNAIPNLLNMIDDLIHEKDLSEILDSFDGVIVNGVTGIVFGFISGGIIGYYENMEGASTMREPELAGVINFGSVMTSIAMALAANKIPDEGSLAFNQKHKNILDNILKKWSYEITVDGEPITGVFTNLLKAFAVGWGGLNVDFDFQIKGLTAGYEFEDIIDKIIVPNYQWTTSRGLIYPETKALMESDNLVINEKDYYKSIGQGASGGIIGLVKTKNKLTLNLAISYAFTVVDGSIHQLNSPITIASGKIASSGSAGGLVGASFMSNPSTYNSSKEELIISLSFNFTPVLGRENAGGILGYAERSTFIYSGSELSVMEYFNFGFITNGYLRGWVANYGSVNAAGNAGGIIGRSDGAHLNTKAVENLYAPHLIKESYYYGFFGEKHEEYVTPELRAPYIVNSGSVSGAVNSGGVVGYASGDTEMYYCKATLSILAIFTGITGLNNLILRNMSIAGSGYVGGLVGVMDGGSISGTCYVGSLTDGLLNINNLLRTTLYGFAEGEENVSCAGGIAGKVSASTKIGGYIGYEQVQKLVNVYVGENVYLGSSSVLDSSFVAYYPAYSGGAIGFVETILPEEYYVKIEAHVSGGEVAVGGWFGKVSIDKNDVLDFSYLNEQGVRQYTKTDKDLKVTGTQISLSDSLDKLIKGIVPGENRTLNIVDAPVVGGVVGYLESGTLTGITIIHTVYGQLGNIVGGVVGKLGGDGIVREVRVQAEHNEGDPIYSTIVAGSKVKNDKTVENNAYALGGIVGYMEGGFIEKTSIDKVILSGGKYVGGVVGFMQAGTIGSSSGVVVSGEVGTATYAGGVVGFIGGDNCHFINVLSNGVYLTQAAKEVITGEADYAGGVVGFMNGGVFEFTPEEGINFNAYTKVHGKFIAGGLVAEMANGTINNGSAGSLEITTGSSYEGENIPALGGLVGKMTGGILAGGTAPSELSGTIVGGLVGWMSANSGNTTSGRITGGTSGTVIASSNESYVGGVVGKMDAGEIQAVTFIEGAVVKNDAGIDNVHLGGIVGTITSGYIASGVTPLEVKGAGSGQVFGGGVAGEVASINPQEGAEDDYIFEIGDVTTTVSGVKYGGGLIGKMSDGWLLSAPAENSTVSATYAGGIIGFAGGGDKMSIKLDIDFKVPDITVTGTESAGGVIGCADGAQIGVGFKATIKGNYSAGASIGGLIGYSINSRVGYRSYEKESDEARKADENINMSMPNGYVTLKDFKITNSTNAKVGGVIGLMEAGSLFGLYLYSTAETNITIDDKVDSFGGIVGKLTSTGSGETKKTGIIYGCQNLVELNFSISGSALGGIAGENDSGEIYLSKNLSSIEAPGFDNIGGIVGINYSDASVMDCQNGSTIDIIHIYGSKKTNLGGIVGQSQGDSRVTSRCENFAELKLGENSSLGNMPSSLWEQHPIFVVKESSSEDYQDASSFSSVYKGSVGGIAGKITDRAFVSGINNGFVYGYYFYGRNSTPDTVRFNDTDIETVYTYEIVDRRGNIVGCNSNAVADGARAVNEKGVTLGSWDHGDAGIDIISWSERESKLTELTKPLQEGYVVEITVLTYRTEEERDAEGNHIKWEYSDAPYLTNHSYKLVVGGSPEEGYEKIKTDYDSLNAGLNLGEAIRDLGLDNLGTLPLSGYLTSKATPFYFDLAVMESTVTSSSKNYQDYGMLTEDSKKIETTFKVYKVKTTYNESTYTTLLKVQDSGGDVSHKRDIYSKFNYTNDRTSQSKALERLFEMYNSAGVNVETVWEKNEVPKGVLFLYIILN